MRHSKILVRSFWFAFLFVLAFVTLTAHTDPGPRDSRASRGWWQAGGRIQVPVRSHTSQSVTDAAQTIAPEQSIAHGGPIRDFLEGRRLFDRETFDGNGRTCATCHTPETGTVSPKDARRRFRADPGDPLFLHDGSDDDDGDGFGDGVHATRMLKDATVLVRVQLHANVEVKGHPEIREVTVRRGVPTTQNSPALDPIIMLDGREPTLQSQARGAIAGHAQSSRVVTDRQANLIAAFQKTPRFFSSPEIALLAAIGRQPGLPKGRTASEKRGRTFFEDLPPDFSVTPPNFKPGACAACHSGPLMNQTNQFLPVPIPPGSRFQSVLVSELNAAGNPVMTFVFRNQENDLNPATNRDGTPDGIIEVSSPDPGRALITGRADDFATFDQANAFKIPQLRGIEDTAPYFHDNSAKTLEDVVEHYAKFFQIVSDSDGPGPGQPILVLTEQDKKDIVAFMKLLK